MTNSGLIEATGSAGLVIAKVVTAGAGGVISAAGGNVLLEGATLNGGTLQSSAGGVIETVSGTNILSGATSNGTIEVSDGTSLNLKGAITDNGTFALDSSSHTTRLVIAAGVTLAGTGSVAMTDQANNRIASNGSAQTLTNNLTIAGAGIIGDTNLTLTNAASGTIDATGSAHSLSISTGAHTVNNAGLIEATGAGGLTLTGALANTGTLAASGGTLNVTGAVTGTGAATIAASTLEFGSSVAATQAVTFAQNTTGRAADAGIGAELRRHGRGPRLGRRDRPAEFRLRQRPEHLQHQRDHAGRQPGRRGGDDPRWRALRHRQPAEPVRSCRIRPTPPPTRSRSTRRASTARCSNSLETIAGPIRPCHAPPHAIRARPSPPCLPLPRSIAASIPAPAAAAAATCRAAARSSRKRSTRCWRSWARSRRSATC